MFIFIYKNFSIKFEKKEFFHKICFGHFFSILFIFVKIISYFKKKKKKRHGNAKRCVLETAGKRNGGGGWRGKGGEERGRGRRKGEGGRGEDVKRDR